VCREMQLCVESCMSRNKTLRKMKVCIVENYETVRENRELYVRIGKTIMVVAPFVKFIG
jgi:hypothetical protein